ncbi:molybdopterin-guanine dinucleotide biosynthesis protein MobA [Sulfurifustis variabilis]|uniref:Molybdopterin-guanine dinucleotide biosynthesis protein MobA n=1 Tax=Sulfurifustis variabilis TaxID=1675686 RepID=A0A1B4VAP5_9GAMM|nr:nucleotidyltransferase family protein [Sulfurifustis variabilis]BAU48824.1 molybdopterin-guanine dinucleotide biosynthesis protein MobA [Sulfurifustis variabilis]
MIAAVLLAAGRSTRFGRNKLLEPLADSEPLGVHAARNVRAAVERCYAVVAGGEAGLGDRFERVGLRVVYCAEAERGMGSSIACGVAAANGMAGYVIALADMPFIAPATIRRVATALQQGALCVAPVYRGRRGHPVGFSGRLRGNLLALEGESGASGLLLRLGARTRLIEVDDPGILRDVDRPEDLP